MSYGTKMIGAAMAAFLISGPIASMSGASDKTQIGVLVGVIAYAVLSVFFPKAG